MRQMSNLPKNSSVNSRNLLAILLFGNGHVRALMVNFLIWVVIPGSEPVPSIISRRRASRSPMDGNWTWWMVIEEKRWCRDRWWKVWDTSWQARSVFWSLHAATSSMMRSWISSGNVGIMMVIR